MAAGETSSFLCGYIVDHPQLHETTIRLVLFTAENRACSRMTFHAPTGSVQKVEVLHVKLHVADGGIALMIIFVEINEVIEVLVSSQHHAGGGVDERRKVHHVVEKPMLLARTLKNKKPMPKADTENMVIVEVVGILPTGLQKMFVLHVITPRVKVNPLKAAQESART